MRNSDAFEKEAIGLLNRGEAETALRVLRDGLALYPGDKDLLLGVAMAQIALGNYVPAVRVLESLRAQHPTWGDVLQGLVEAYLAMNRKKQAVEAATQAIGPHEKDSEFCHVVGGMLFEHDLYREAAACHKRALELNRGFAPAYLAYGVCAHKLGDRSAAIDAVEKAVRHAPDFWEAASFLGNIFYDSKRRADAQRVWNSIPVDKLRDPVTLKRLILLCAGPQWAEKRKALRAQQKAVEKVRSTAPRLEKAGAVLEKLDERMDLASLARHPRGEGGYWNGMLTLVDRPAGKLGLQLNELLSRMAAAKLDLKKRTHPSIQRLDRKLTESFLVGLADFLDEFPWLYAYNAAQQGIIREPGKKTESLYDSSSSEEPVRLAGDLADLTPGERRRRGLANIFGWADVARLMFYGKAVLIESRKRIGKDVFPHAAVVKLREAVERLKADVPLKTEFYEAWVELRAALEP